MKIKKITFGAFVGLGVILAVIFFWKLASFVKSVGEASPNVESAQYYMPAPTPGTDLDAIEANAAISIPANATEIYALISGFRELDTWVRFDLPPNDLTSFLEETLCTEDLVSINPAEYRPYELDPDWWEPHTSTDLIACYGQDRYDRQTILVDRTNPDVLTIYVLNLTDDFGTPTAGP